MIALIGPIVTKLTGFEGAQIGVMQSLIGFGSIVGLVIGSKLADARPFRSNITVMYAAMCLSQALWSLLLFGARCGDSARRSYPWDKRLLSPRRPRLGGGCDRALDLAVVGPNGTQEWSAKIVNLAVGKGPEAEVIPAQGPGC